MAFSVFMTITQKTGDTNLDVAPLDQVKIYILCYSLCNAESYRAAVTLLTFVRNNKMRTFCNKL